MLIAEGDPLQREATALFELTIHHISRVEPCAPTDMLPVIKKLTNHEIWAPGGKALRNLSLRP